MAKKGVAFRVGEWVGDFQLGRRLRYSGSIHDPNTPVSVALTGLPTTAGVSLNKDSALGLTAVWNAVQQISQDFGTFSKCVYRVEGSRTVKVDDHPLATLLQEPNSIQSGPVFFESLCLCYLLRGNALAYIKKKNGRPDKLILLDPDNTEIRISPQGNIFYDSQTMYGIEKEIVYKNLSSNEVFHVPNLSYTGIWGIDIIKQFRDALGLTKSQENYNNELYVNGATPTMAISFEGMLPERASEQINKKIQDQHVGFGNHHRAFVLGQNAKVTQLTFNPEQMSFLGSREFQVEEVARMTNMPLHKIKSMKSSTNNNIEHQSKEYYQDTQQPIITKFEAEAHRKLVATDQKATHFIEWEMDDILRADVKTRYAAYGQAIVNKIMVPNEVRSKEGLPPADWGDDPVDFQSPANSQQDGNTTD